MLTVNNLSIEFSRYAEGWQKKPSVLSETCP